MNGFKTMDAKTMRPPKVTYQKKRNPKIMKYRYFQMKENQNHIASRPPKKHRKENDKNTKQNKKSKKAQLIRAEE